MTKTLSRLLFTTLWLFSMKGAQCLAASPETTTVPPGIEFHNQTFSIVLDGRNVMSISGDSFVYNLGNETIVITGKNEVFRNFLTKIKEGHRNVKVTVVLVPEQKSLYNARFDAFHQHHPAFPKRGN